MSKRIQSLLAEAAGNGTKKASVAKTPESKGDSVVVITPLKRRTVTATIVGTSPLVVHRFSAKALSIILAKQMGSKSSKEKRDPEADYLRSMYPLAQRGRGGKIRYGFPVTGIKDAIATAAVKTGAAKYKSEIFSLLHIHSEPSEPDKHGDLIMSPQPCAEIMCAEPAMRTDPVRLSGPTRGADIRFRGEFPAGWKMRLTIEYVSDLISGESVLNLLDKSGFFAGIGEFRREKGGEWGMYRTDTSEGAAYGNTTE